MSTTMLSLVLFCAAAPPVETSKTPETMLYVRTTPSGAEILLDGKPLGTAPGLFKVPPGVRRIVVELGGHEPDGGDVTIKAGHIRRLEFKLKRRPGRAAEGATDSVTDVLNQWQAAISELDFEKLEALFLPPDDTPAGKARRKDLEDTKEHFLELKAAGVTAELWCVGIQQRRDGKDSIVSVTMVSRITSPAGEVEKGERAYQFRMTPTKDGWKIAEVKLLDQPVVTPVAPAPRAGRPRQEGGFAEEAEVKRKEGRVSMRGPVAEVLKQFEAALKEGNVEKLEALFLPPDDTPAGKARRKHLEQARGEFSDPKRKSGRIVVRLLQMKTRPDGKDKLFTAEILDQNTLPDGRIEGRQRTLELRITPTEDGWKIAEVDVISERKVTFEAAPPPSQTRTDEDLQRRRVGKKVSDFPEAVDLSTPESACAAYRRANARKDAKAVADLSWVKIDPAEMERFWTEMEPEDLAIYNKAKLEAEIVEVWIYRDRLAMVVSRLAFPPGKGHYPHSGAAFGPPYSGRSFGVIEGQWKNLGENRHPSLEAAVATFKEKKERLWEHFREIEEALTATRSAIKPPPAPEPERQRHFVRIVVGRDAMSFEGEETTWALLPALLEKVPNRQSTVLEIAVASDDMTLKQKNDATGRALPLARRFGFEYLSYIGVQLLGSKGSRTQTLPEKQAPSVTQAPKKVHLPEEDTRGAEVVLDLASGQTLAKPSREADASAFSRMGKGDLFYDDVLGCLRGARAMRWDGRQFVAEAIAGRQGDTIVYKLPKAPCRFLITTAEKRHFDVTITSISKDGIRLEYRPADPAVVPQEISAGRKTEKRDSE